MSSATNQFTVGQTITNDKAFTTPTGVHFKAGTKFTVDLVGVSTRCHAERCGTVVWISDGWFLTQ